MEQPHFTVSWNAYQRSICSGLSSLQQRGEFVDMTLAAEGHHVKVHRMVMSLVSPYIKELIASADCPHPVIFLNQISYRTLCSLLEYVYTGEVLVTKENLNEFIAAGKSLHIRGLEEMNVDHTLPIFRAPYVQLHNTDSNSSIIIKENKEDIKMGTSVKKDRNIHEVFISEDAAADDDMDNSYDEDLEPQYIKIDEKSHEHTGSTSYKRNASRHNPAIQYSVSNQGNLQMVLNRCLYYLVYTGKTSGHRRWQCIDNHVRKFKCPAAVVTKNGVIVQRISAHNHPFHDAKILKKVQSGSIYSALQQAENMGKLLQDERNCRSASTSSDKADDSK